MTVPYLCEKDEVTVLRPTHCPRTSDSGEPCRIIFKGTRVRSTGPDHALALAFCRTHQRRFTLYPPGFFPYGREAMVCVTPSGEPVLRDNDDSLFIGTYFQAAIDAAKGVFWPKESVDGHLEPRYTTQARRVDRALHLLQLIRGSPVDSVRRVLNTGGVPGMVYIEAGKRVGCDLTSKGSRVMTILENLLEQTAWRTLRTLVHLADFWPSLQAGCCVPTRECS